MFGADIKKNQGTLKMITKNHVATLAVLLACGFASAARADGLDYDFVDINASRITPEDNFYVDHGEGFGVNGSYGLPADFTIVGAAGSTRYNYTHTLGFDETVYSYSTG